MASIVGVSASVGKFQLVGEVILKFKGKSPIKCVEIRAKEIHQKLCDVQKLFIETIQPDEQKDRNYLTVGISYILSKSSYVPKESGRTVIYTNFQVPGCSLLSADDFVEGGRQNQGNYSGSEFIRRVEERTKRGLETKKDSKSELRSDAAAHTEQAIYEYIEQNPDYFVKQLLSCLGTLEKVKVYALILHMHSSWQMCGNCEGALIDLQANAALRARIASAFQEKGLATPKNKSLPIHVIFSQTGKYPPKGRALPVELNCAKAIGSIPTFWIKESPSALKASIARFTTFKSARNQGTISEVDNLGMAYQSHTTSAPHAAFEREASGRKRKREEDKKGDHPEKRLRLEALIQFPEVSRYKDQDGKTYPHQAALLGDAEMLESFVESPADISARDQFGFTPFHYLGMGSAKKSEAMIDLLKKGGADIGADSVIGKPVEVAAAAFRARVLYRLSTEQENQERENLKEEMLKLAQEYLDISNTYLFASYRPGSDLSYYQDECACTETLNRISSAMRSTLVEQGENFSVVRDFIIVCFYYFLSSVDEPAKSLVEKWVASSPRHHEMASYLLFEAANCDSPPPEIPL